MARYKKYRYGGKRVPGMYKAQDGNGENIMSINTDNQSRPTSPIGPQIQSMDEKPTIQASGQSLDQVMEPTQNPNMQVQQQNQKQQMMVQLQKQKMQQQIQMQKMMMQMKLQNDMLKQQNELMQTRLQKLDMINSARTTKTMAGSKNTPKRYGGANKKVKGFVEGNAGNVMRHGGGLKKMGKCLPGGRFSKKRR